MRILFVALLIVGCTSFQSRSQGFEKQPLTITLSYFGEMLTNPGFKLSVEVGWQSWEKVKTKNDGSEKRTDLRLTPELGVGLFFHPDYQTALFVIPGLYISRQNERGGYWGGGFGLGYMRTFASNVYEVDDSGQVQNSSFTNNYFVTDIFLAFGKDQYNQGKNLGYYFKPHFMIASPNYVNNVGYFITEFGVKYYLD